MRKFISVILLLIIVLSFTLAGCSGSGNYMIYNENIIKIGVLLSQSQENSYGPAVLDGIKYAAQLAPSVNIDDKYLIELSVSDINDDISDTVSKFSDEKVAAVICAAESAVKTDEIIKAFDGKGTPLVFVDCYSNNIAKDDESFAICIPYSYQSSVVSSYFISSGFKNGAVIFSDDRYSKSFAQMFKDTFINSGGSKVAEYEYGADISAFDARTVASENPEFIFVIGDNNSCVQIHSVFKSAGVKSAITFSEVFDKTSLQTSALNDTLFISKFEVDANNYIGTDFLSVYSNYSEKNKSEISSASAYGYDAYMLIYGALMSYHTSITSTTEGSGDIDSAKLTTEDVKNAISNTTHMGVTDSFVFDDSGLVNTNFVYLSTIENSNAVMLNRYNYSNGIDR